MTPTPLEDFLTGITTILTSFIGWLATVTSYLITNPIFQIMAGFIIALLLIGLVVGLLKGIKRRKR